MYKLCIVSKGNEVYSTSDECPERICRLRVCLVNDKMLPEQGIAEGLPATAPLHAPIGDSPMALPCCVSIGGSEILSFA